MQRIALVAFATTVALLMGSFACAENSSSDRPNVILILVDDLGWKDLGCQGSEYYETPHIDALAAGGMRFTQGYAACAVCSPTRAAVLTGKYPGRLGITDWIRGRRGRKSKIFEAAQRGEFVSNKGRPLLTPANRFALPLEEVTLAERLKEVGYTTCHVGKWHLGDPGQWPTDQGFDINIGGCDFGSPPSYFDPYANRRSPDGIPTLPPRNKGEYLADREADEAANFIKQHQDEPFFLSYWPYEVHTPIQGKPELIAHYKKKPKTEQSNPEYAAMVHAMDAAVGRITKALEKYDLTEETLIVFTADNGGLATIKRLDGPTNNAPLRSGKGYPYEGGLRVPFIVSWPGVIEAGSTSGEAVCSIDVTPTICEAVGVEIPESATIDGLSLWPHLTSAGQDAIDRDTLIWHFPHYRRPDVVPYSVIRQGPWKLIKRYEGPTFELYNLAKDPYEDHDLAAKRPGTVKSLDEELRDRLTDMGAKIPYVADKNAASSSNGS